MTNTCPFHSHLSFNTASVTVTLTAQCTDIIHLRRYANENSTLKHIQVGNVHSSIVTIILISQCPCIVYTTAAGPFTLPRQAGHRPIECASCNHRVKQAAWNGRLHALH